MGKHVVKELESAVQFHRLLPPAVKKLKDELERTKRNNDNNIITIQLLKGRIEEMQVNSSQKIEEMERKRCGLKSENEQLVTSNHDFKSENKHLQNKLEQICQKNETLEEKITMHALDVKSFKKEIDD